MSHPSAIVFYDGECAFCQRSVQFILRHERAPLFSFAPLQSALAVRLLGEQVPTISSAPASVVVLLEGKIFSRSDAALQIARHLRWPWRGLIFLRVFPRPLRDMAYRFIARHRHKILPGKSACLLPAAAQRARFLSDENSSAPA